MPRAALGALAAWLVLPLGAPSSQPAPARPGALVAISPELGFTPQDWASVDAGRAVARVLDSETREVAVAGAVRIAASRASFADRIRGIEYLKASAAVLDSGRFGAEPRPADLETAPFEDYNLDLRGCRAGDCRVRLTADDIARFHRDVDWNRPDWRARSSAVWREVLAGHAAAYLRDGRTALPVYANRSDPLGVPGELSLLVARMGFLGAVSPTFHTYLHEFRRPLPAASEEVLYWTKEDFGIRPVFRIQHQVVHAGSTVLVATNQVYADHYLDASLGLTLAIDAPSGGFYMVTVNRARTRSLTGVMRRMVRGTVQGRSRDALRKILTSTKGALEGASRSGAGGAPADRVHP